MNNIGMIPLIFGGCVYKKLINNVGFVNRDRALMV